MKKFLFLVILFTVFISKTNAVPAYPYPIKYTQPDGSVITVQLKGDERVHWAESSDGYTLLSNGKNGWEYAVADQSGDIKASGILAREVGKRTVNELKMLKGVSKNIRFSSKQVNTLKAVWEAKYGSEKLVGTSDFFRPNLVNATTNDGRRKVFTPTGNKKLIMILIEYTDVKFTKTRQNFVDLMNTQDYNLNGAQGSVRQYFYEMSYGQFSVQTDVAPYIYTADYDMAYYGAPNGSAHDIRANDLMKEAIEKVIMGPSRKSHLMTDAEKKVTAYHEGGHALVGSVLPQSDPVHKVTILSRGRALGYTMKLPTEDKLMHTKNGFLDEIAALLGGYAAEKLIFGELTTGASNDLKVATGMARKLVTQYGMSDAVGPVVLGAGHENVFLGRDIGEQKNYSEDTAQKIDAEVRRIMSEAEVRATAVMTEHRSYLDTIAERLIKEETLEQEAFTAIVKDIIPATKKLIPEFDSVAPDNTADDTLPSEEEPINSNN